ncbi:hypothetical protein K144316041_p21710 (plasmid) [Clostridium tetani]|uniref:hypothetical protein n=1 Tax=Clostridium tetani TaxID=1513 RepID=UPI002953CE34|nr:hypothetical protein [Clostridium tetani]BDR74332.1 hypothetical protein K144316041_p21710 [Clostridium tetani]
MKIDKRLMELLEKEFVTVEELEKIEEHEQVEETEFCGASGKHIGHNWYNITLINKEEYNIYL